MNKNLDSIVILRLVVVECGTRRGTHKMRVPYSVIDTTEVDRDLAVFRVRIYIIREETDSCTIRIDCNFQCFKSHIIAYVLIIPRFLTIRIRIKTKRLFTLTY